MEEIEEKILHVTILNQHGEEMEHYSGAISDPRMSYHYNEYLTYVTRMEMGGNKEIHKSFPTKE